jgi:hypothetical protein
MEGENPDASRPGILIPQSKVCRNMAGVRPAARPSDDARFLILHAPLGQSPPGGYGALHPSHIRTWPRSARTLDNPARDPRYEAKRIHDDTVFRGTA